MPTTTPALRFLRPDGDVPPVRGQLSTNVVDDPDGAAELAPEWRELVEASGASPFMGPEYALTWWRHRGRGRLHLVTVRVDGRLCALAPLHVRPLAGMRVARWLGHGLGTVAEVLVRPGHAAAARSVWAHLAGERRLLLDLVEYRDDGGGLAELRRSSDVVTSVALRDVCPVLELDGLQSKHDVLKRLHRRHGLRRSCARAERRLLSQGVEFEFGAVADSASLHANLPEIDAVYDAAEAHHPRLHLLRPPWRAFLIELLEVLLQRGQAKVFTARFDGQLAAIEITIEDALTTTHWVSRFDPAFSEFSPGHLLTREIVGDALDRGAARCDMLIGDGPHKLPFATASYDTLTVQAAPHALGVRRAALGATVALRGAVGAVRSPLAGGRS